MKKTNGDSLWLIGYSRAFKNILSAKKIIISFIKLGFTKISPYSKTDRRPFSFEVIKFLWKQNI